MRRRCAPVLTIERVVILMDVQVGDGRTREADVLGQTAGAAAGALALAVFGEPAPGSTSVFSLKVDGVVLPLDATVASGDVAELVEVTDYTWPEDKPDDPVVPVVDAYPADGTVDDVLAWVGVDVDRARDALNAEDGRDQPRSTLIAQLEDLLDKT